MYHVFSKCESAHLCIAFPDTLILETMVKLLHVIYTAMTLFYDKLNLKVNLECVFMYYSTVP